MIKKRHESSQCWNGVTKNDGISDACADGFEQAEHIEQVETGIAHCILAEMSILVDSNSTASLYLLVSFEIWRVGQPTSMYKDMFAKKDDQKAKAIPA